MQPDLARATQRVLDYVAAQRAALREVGEKERVLTRDPGGTLVVGVVVFEAAAVTDVGRGTQGLGCKRPRGAGPLALRPAGSPERGTARARSRESTACT